MRILQLHSNYIEYQPVKKEIDSAEDVELKLVRIDDVVVLLTSVEADDDDSTVSKAIGETEDSLRHLDVKRLVIYPYAHLSANLARPLDALRILKDIEARLKVDGYEVHRSPFGWNKSFSISVKGHPLAEQSRTITGDIHGKSQKVSKALVGEKKLKSSFYIINTNGDVIPIDRFDFKEHELLRTLKDYEVNKSRDAKEAPPHVGMMKRLGLADHEPGSDLGNLRFYPKGRFMKSLIEKYVTKMVKEYGALEVETPIMYDSGHPSLADYLDRFPARQYLIKSDDRDLFLRFSACFGQFLMASDAQFSYKQLPLKLYELTRYSFRKEKSGELVGLRRLRAFTMPDSHAMCRDMDQAKNQIMDRFELSRNVMKGIGLDNNDYEMSIRITEEFYNSNKELVHNLVRISGRPALLEIWKEKFFYFVFKWEFNFIDNLGKASALSTDQIDVENAKRYGITYVNEGGDDVYPVILHNSPSGAIERCIYALLERAYRIQRAGGVPSLPFWLSPTQVRLIPLSKDFLNKSIEFSESLESRGVRVDIDDRELSVGKKVRDAEKEWIRFIIVIGEKEVESNLLQVRDREAGKMVQMRLEDLVKRWDELSSGVVDTLPLPKMTSQRPQFA